MRECCSTSSTKHSLPLWSELGARFKRAVVLRGGGPVTGSRLLQAGPDEIAEPNVRFQSIIGLTELAEALAHAGRIAEGLAVVEAGLEQPEIGWRTLELLRLKGELFLLQSNPAVARDGGGPLPAGARWGAPARDVVLGVARRDEPRPPAAQSGPTCRCHRLPPAGLRPLHGGFRHRRSDRGEAAAGRARRCPPRLSHARPKHGSRSPSRRCGSLSAQSR